MCFPRAGVITYWGLVRDKKNVLCPFFFPPRLCNLIGLVVFGNLAGSSCGLLLVGMVSIISECLWVKLVSDPWLVRECAS